MPVISKKNSPQNRVQRLTDEQRDLAERNIKLVYHVINTYKHRWRYLDLGTITSECMYGLMKAARNYDESLGYQFSTFACACMFRHTSSIHYRVMNDRKHVMNRNSVQYDCDYDWKECDKRNNSIESTEEVELILSLVKDKKDRKIIRQRIVDGDSFHTIAKSVRNITRMSSTDTSVPSIRCVAV